MSHIHKKIAVMGLVVILAIVNWSIFKNERHLAEGRIVYIELAPVDPRSLMQGDYMALNFHMANKLYGILPKADLSFNWSWRRKVDASDGIFVAKLDLRNVATFKTLLEKQRVEVALPKDEILLRYRVRNGEVKFATNGYFFQEGQGAAFESARFGQFRVDSEGELLLVDMYDQDLKKIEPETANEEHSE